MLHKFLLTVLLGIALMTSVGCVHAIFSADPIRRDQQLIYKSEDLRLLQDDWERFWRLDMPSHTTPYRTHGGII